MAIPLLIHIRLILGQLLSLHPVDSSTTLQRLLIFAEEEESVQVKGEEERRRVVKVKGYTPEVMQKTDPALSSPLTMVQIVVKLVNGIIATSRPFYPPPLYHLPPSFTSTSTSAGSAPPSSSSPPFPRKQSSFPRRHLHHSQTLHLSNLKLLALKRKQRREREARIDRRSEMRLGGLRKETQRIHEQNQELEAEIMRIQQRTVELMREVRWEEMLGEMIAGEEARRD